MSENTIKVGLDATGVEKGVDKAAAALGKLGKAADATGKAADSGLGRAEKAVMKTGNEADKAAKKQERATRSIVSSIEREIAAREAGGRNTAGYYEALAKRRGADVAQVQKFTAELKKQESQLKLNNITIGQYQNAMRMVPAQMTDVVTQLAGGQNPFLIALQQGGQLRDSFGGFGNMMKGLAASINPVTLGVGGLAVGVGVLGKAMLDGYRESQAFERALIMTGNSAGLTASQLQAVSTKVGESVGAYSQAREAVLAFVNSGKVAAEDYERLTNAVVLQSQATGQSVADLAQQYIDIAADPLAAVVKFSGVYKTLTADVYDQAKALIEQGRQQEAVALIQRKLADESEDMAKRVLENLGWMEKGWNRVTQSISEAWEEMKGIGRENGVAQQLAKARAELKALEIDTSGGFGAWSSNDKAVSDKKAQIRLLEQALQQEQELAAREAARAREGKEAVAAAKTFSDLQEKQLSKEARFRKEILNLERELQALKKGGNAQQIADAERALQARKREQAAELAADKEKSGKSKKGKDGLSGLSDNQRRLVELTRKSGEDAAKWLALYEIESGSGKKLLNHSSGAMGHFQVMPQYLADYGLNRAGAYDLSKSYHAVRKHHARGSGGLKKMLGRELTAGEYYLGHQQGWAGAKALLSNPDKNVVDALATIMSRGRAAASVSQNGGNRNMTARQFAAMWIEKANKLQAKYADKVGGLSSDAAAGLDSGQFELGGYDKFMADFSKRQADAATEAKLKAESLNGVYTEQLRLLSDPTFESWSESQKQAALELAKSADVQTEQNRLTAKFADLLKQVKEESERDFEDQLFELELIGKTADEQERLTAARKYDKLIAQAEKDGASPDVLASLQAEKLNNDGRIRERQRLAKETKEAHGVDWIKGLDEGVKGYLASFGTMREQVSGLVTDSIGKMADGLAEFVATGKMDFKALTASMLQDISRVLVKMAIMNAMKAAFGYSEGGVVEGYASGGYTGNGGKYEPAGIVHRGEVVFSQRDVRNHGGVAAVERLRLKGYADGGAVGIAPASLAAVRGAVGGGVSNMQVNITINRDGSAESDVSADTELARNMAAALPAMVEKWYVNNVHRPGGIYYRAA